MDEIIPPPQPVGQPRQRKRCCHGNVAVACADCYPCVRNPSVSKYACHCSGCHPCPHNTELSKFMCISCIPPCKHNNFKGSCDLCKKNCSHDKVKRGCKISTIVGMGNYVRTAQFAALAQFTLLNTNIRAEHVIANRC